MTLAVPDSTHFSSSIQAARPDDAPIYVVLDILSARKGAKIRS